MTLPVRLHPLAADDLVAAWGWYEEQVPGLGDRFLAAVRATIESVAAWPGSGAPIVRDEGAVVERRSATSGFPYVVRYRVIDDAVVVMAVHHQRRHPDAAADRQP